LQIVAKLLQIACNTCNHVTHDFIVDGVVENFFLWAKYATFCIFYRKIVSYGIHRFKALVNKTTQGFFFAQKLCVGV